MTRTAGTACRHSDDSRMASSTLSAAAQDWYPFATGPRSPHRALQSPSRAAGHREGPHVQPPASAERPWAPRTPSLTVLEAEAGEVRVPGPTRTSVHSVRSGAGRTCPDAPCGRPGATGATSRRALHLAPPSRHDEGAGRRMIPPARPFAETVDRSRLSLTRVRRDPSQWLSERGRPGRARRRGR